MIITMVHKRKRKFNKEDKDQPNLKRFRNDLMKLTSENEMKHDSQTTRGGTHVNRKQRRKEQRKFKKARRLAHSKGEKMWSFEAVKVTQEKQRREELVKKEQQRQRDKKKDKEEKRKQKRKEKKEMEAESKKQAMREEIKREEKMLKQLEKQLHMNRRKSKNLPQSFIDDGLDYLLDAVDENKISELYNKDSDSDLGISDEEYKENDEEEEEDDESDNNDRPVHVQTNDKVDRIAKSILKLTKQSTTSTKNKKELLQNKKVHFEGSDESDDKGSCSSDDLDEDDEENLSEKAEEDENIGGSDDEDDDDDKEEEDEVGDDYEEEVSDDDADDEEEEVDDDDDEEEVDDDNDEDDNDEEEEDEIDDDSEEHTNISAPVLREDIYGRLRDAEGNIVTDPGATKYTPPARRSQQGEGDQKKKQQLERLKKQLKGFVNRASETNMQSICSQIEAVYISNSRANVTETLSDIVLTAVVSPVLASERLAMELVMMLTILHGNIGSEIGATFLERLVKRFDDICNHDDGVGKEMDNVVLLLCHMYNFKIIHNLLICDIVRKFLSRFQEKDVELLLLILKNVGFSLRKDDPAVLKDMIQEIQSKASSMDTSHSVDQSRVRYMLDTLLAIKNNNMRKIPNYNPELFEQLKKSTRSILKGHSLGDGQLRISLEDLLHAENKGKWWIVGSAWDGRQREQNTEVVTMTTTSSVDGVSSKILQLAHKQRMNTDIRRNIFCVMMTAEDYVDAFEKLLKLGLKNQQEREIIHVIIDSCQQEKSYNPFYAFLMQKFCDCDRRFQMTFQFTLWDKFKEMSNTSEQKRNNLAKMVVHLLATKSQSLSIFKVVEFGTLDTAMVRFMKQVITELLLDQPEDVMEAVFLRIAPLSKLQMLQEELKLFMQHFLLKKKSKNIQADPKLKDRVAVAIKALSAAQNKMLL